MEYSKENFEKLLQENNELHNKLDKVNQQLNQVVESQRELLYTISVLNDTITELKAQLSKNSNNKF